ncbi:ABC transporter substrate-binding protein [Sedimenticola sp.]|uniref:ABC transporter substrate-binding protein n=1 Tax=Sedimenticola sp. TaxID=1940285 RepID=UPI002585CB4C|nr:ABC transporter substrate-binding protein [Sedimenticola sp.]MCW8904644.1 ABC transporter substrate-binding protein [Sedimenticola sp.]
MQRVFLITGLVVLLVVASVAGAASASIPALYIKQRVERPPVLANLEEIPEDGGLAGARLAIKDSNTTGRFTGQRFELRELEFEATTDSTEIIRQLQAAPEYFVILDLPAVTLEAVLTDDLGRDRLLFNVAAPDNRFRTELCRPDLLHTFPSRAMLADALTQYLVTKRWNRWLLIEGPLERDRLFANAMRRAATKFGARIIEQKTWDGARDARRTAQAEVPRLTQGVEYDVLVVADEWGDFGDYLMYRTWDPRPVVGTQGLFPTAWYRTIEQWGATQLQVRFSKSAGRPMDALDYAAWAALRSIGEAAVRGRSSDAVTIGDYIRTPEFELAAYKGRKLSYRPWSGQLRQPVALSTARSLVSQSPQEGFLHQQSELDTLGFDRPEVQCERR